MVKVTVLNNKMVEVGSSTFADAYAARPFIDMIIAEGGFVKVEVI